MMSVFRLTPMYMLLVHLLYACSGSLAIAQDTLPIRVEGNLKSPWNDETSGLAASAINKGLLYIHNDSGDTSRFFLISPDGTLKAVYTFQGNSLLPKGVADCEDMTVGVGPAAGKSYIYIGDIGDNNAKRRCLTVYRIPEPVYRHADTTVYANLPAEPLYLKYPDGPRDAETLMIDPVERLLYIISKREDSVGIYTTPLLFKQGDTAILTRRATLFFSGVKIGFEKQITGGSVSADGSQTLVKSYAKVYYWKRKGKEPLWRLLLTPPREMPYQREAQGEAIGFAIRGTGYYTISEGVHPQVRYYSLK